MEMVHSRVILVPSMFCAFGPKTDSCQGDSGGPIVVDGDDSFGDVQVGIISWGYGTFQFKAKADRMLHAHQGSDFFSHVCCLNSYVANRMCKK